MAYVQGCMTPVHQQWTFHSFALTHWYTFFTDEKDAVSPKERGTKVAGHYVLTVPGGGKSEIQVRIHDDQETPPISFGPEGFDAVFEERKNEADEFYQNVWVCFLACWF